MLLASWVGMGLLIKLRTMPMTMKRRRRMTSGCGRFSCTIWIRFPAAPRAVIRAEICRFDRLFGFKGYKKPLRNLVNGVVLPTLTKRRRVKPAVVVVKSPIESKVPLELTARERSLYEPNKSLSTGLEVHFV
jgi:hypothetical protein